MEPLPRFDTYRLLVASSHVALHSSLVSTFVALVQLAARRSQFAVALSLAGFKLSQSFISLARLTCNLVVVAPSLADSNLARSLILPSLLYLARLGHCSGSLL